MESLEEKIGKWIAPKLEMEELFLVSIEVGNNYNIKIFVDAEEGSLPIRKCVRVSRHLEEYLDVDDSVAEKYTLEVSSPGLENALKIPKQYQKLIGKILRIRTYEEDNFTAELLEANEEYIVVKDALVRDENQKGRFPTKKQIEQLNKEPYNIAYGDIKKAKEHFEI